MSWKFSTKKDRCNSLDTFCTFQLGRAQASKERIELPSFLPSRSRSGHHKSRLYTKSLLPHITLLSTYEDPEANRWSVLTCGVSGLGMIRKGYPEACAGPRESPRRDRGRKADMDISTARQVDRSQPPDRVISGTGRGIISGTKKQTQFVSSPLLAGKCSAASSSIR